MSKQFVHLHLHSGFSLLDGAIDHDVLAQTAAKHGMPAVAVTDHGNLFGAMAFHNAATKAGVKPIIGCEMYVSKTDHKDRDPASDLEVDFISMTDPGVTHTGKVLHVNPTAEPHEEHGNIVRIRIEPDAELSNPRPGATVTANVHCGRAPWLWAKLHEAWEWLETSPVMF